MEKNEKRIDREKKVSTIKKIAGWASKFCVSAFFSAVSASVVGSGKDKKLERCAAIAGGYLVGSYIGDKVTDYVCAGIDDIYAEYERLESETSDEENDNIEGGVVNA